MKVGCTNEAMRLKGFIKILFLIFCHLLACRVVQAELLKSLELATMGGELKAEQTKSLEILDGALGRLREKYKAGSSPLSQAYEDWKKIYNDFAKQSDKVDSRVRDFQELAAELFTEWDEEAKSIVDRTLQSRSLAKLSETKDKFADVSEHLLERKEQEKRIITQLRDRMLFIKHNLNAESLNALSDEADDIESDIEDLMIEVKKSVDKIDVFVATLR